MPRKFRVEFTFPGDPLTKSNNMKWWRGRMRIPARIARYEQGLKDFALQVMHNLKKRPTAKLVRAEVIYYLGNKRRRDLQNLPKTTMDALNEIVYHDDSQVHDLHIMRRLDRENPRTHIIIEEMNDQPWDEG